MVFRGTERRTAEEIARQVDSVGGNLDAFTAKEWTASTAKSSMSICRFASMSWSDLVLQPEIQSG